MARCTPATSRSSAPTWSARVGGFREGYDGSQDHDLVLRVTEVARRVVHIDEVLYHWRVVPGSAAGDADAKPYASIAGRNAVQDHLDRLGVAARVEVGPYPGHYVIDRDLDPAVAVSVIIPTRGTSGLAWGLRRTFVVEAVRSLLARTEHQNLEIVRRPRHVEPRRPSSTSCVSSPATASCAVAYDEPFNFSKKMNLGALHASGDRLVLLNDDVELISDRWLENLVAPARRARRRHDGRQALLQQRHHPARRALLRQGPVPPRRSSATRAPPPARSGP